MSQLPFGGPRLDLGDMTIPIRADLAPLAQGIRQAGVMLGNFARSIGSPLRGGGGQMTFGFARQGIGQRLGGLFGGALGGSAVGRFLTSPAAAIAGGFIAPNLIAGSFGTVAEANLAASSDPFLAPRNAFDDIFSSFGLRGLTGLAQRQQDRVGPILARSANAARSALAGSSLDPLTRASDIRREQLRQAANAREVGFSQAAAEGRLSGFFTVGRFPGFDVNLLGGAVNVGRRVLGMDTLQDAAMRNRRELERSALQEETARGIAAENQFTLSRRLALMRLGGAVTPRESALGGIAVAAPVIRGFATSSQPMSVRISGGIE